VLLHLIGRFFAIEMQAVATPFRKTLLYQSEALFALKRRNASVIRSHLRVFESPITPGNAYASVRAFCARYLA
jgi:hypothetical protein